MTEKKFSFNIPEERKRELRLIARFDTLVNNAVDDGLTRSQVFELIRDRINKELSKNPKEQNHGSLELSRNPLC